MTFDEWHQKQLNGDADNCPHEAWERRAWDAAILAEREACAAVCDQMTHDWGAGPNRCADNIRMRSNVEHNRRPQGVRVDGPVGPHSEDKG